VVLREDYDLCHKGQPLTVEQAKLLVSQAQNLRVSHDLFPTPLIPSDNRLEIFCFVQKLFEYKVAEFKLQLVCSWSKGGYQSYVDGDAADEDEVEQDDEEEEESEDGSDDE
jgi:hypothetical protein